MLKYFAELEVISNTLVSDLVCIQEMMEVCGITDRTIDLETIKANRANIKSTHNKLMLAKDSAKMCLVDNINTANKSLCDELRVTLGYISSPK